MKEENKWHLFVDSIEVDLGLQRKKTRLCDQSEVDKCLYKQFLQKHSERVTIDGVILKAQVLSVQWMALELEGSAWDMPISQYAAGDSAAAE
jgi:hypothetical protein